MDYRIDHKKLYWSIVNGGEQFVIDIEYKGENLIFKSDGDNVLILNKKFIKDDLYKGSPLVFNRSNLTEFDSIDDNIDRFSRFLVKVLNNKNLYKKPFSLMIREIFGR